MPSISQRSPERISPRRSASALTCRMISALGRPERRLPGSVVGADPLEGEVVVAAVLALGAREPAFGAAVLALGASEWGAGPAHRSMLWRAKLTRASAM
ncbi:MAG: hypothetical protein ACRD0Z_17825 [Acidimicrobiales bacterium]